MVRLGRTLAITLSLIAATGTRALAAKPIVTPMVYGERTNASYHMCQVLNIGTQAELATIEIVDHTGNVVGSDVDVSIEPGRAALALVDISTTLVSRSYCRVSGISKSKARITHCVLANTEPDSCIPATARSGSRP